MPDIGEWLDGIGMSEYRQLFSENRIDFDVLPDIGEDDLKDIGVPLGHRKRLMRAIRDLGPDGPGPAPQHRPAASPAPAVATGPEHLAERVIRGEAALEGERKLVTVLFADVRGSTGLIEALDAEDSETLLRLAVDTMRAAVQRYGGTVSKLLGDGIMAVFGAPLSHEDHAVRACYAALAMQGDMRAVTEHARRRFGAEVLLRVGLNSGEVVVRTTQKDLTLVDYDAIGPTVHLAARMEQLAAPGTIRLARDSERLAEGFIEARALGPVPVKGLSHPVEVFDLVGAVDVRSRFRAGARRGLSRFVGRDDELAALRRALERARRGEGQVASVAGEAGVGKSRLFHEFLRTPPVRDWLVLESGSVSHGRASAFQPLADLLRHYFGLAPSDDERTVRERVIGKLVALDEAFRPQATLILALFAVRTVDAAWETMDPAHRRHRTLEACRALLLREAQVQPLLVVFEDLHWIDGETQAFLDLLVGCVARAPILLLLNHRPEYRDPWLGKSYFTHLRIDPLAPESGASLLRGLLGGGAELEPLRALILRQTEGNPLFMEECVRALAEAGALAGEPGAYRLVVPVRAVSVPSTVQTVLAARIDRLEPAVKRLLQTAAVIGKDFALPLLRRVAGLPEERVREHLDLLQGAEFVYETRLFPEPEYTFKHALTQQVAYEGLLHDRRRELHASILLALEATAGQATAQRSERLAHHAVRGEAWGKAYRHAMDAGLRAAALNAHRSALEAFETAADALARLPQTEERLGEAVDLRLHMRDALFVLGDRLKARTQMDAAERLSLELRDRKRLVSVLLYQSGFHWSEGQHREHALPIAERAYALASEAGDREDVGLSCYRLASAHTLLGEYHEATRWAEEGLRALEPQAGTLFRFGGLVYTFLASFDAMARAELGDFAGADRVGRLGYELAVAADHAYSETVSAFGLTHSLLLQGRVGEALPILERGLDKIAVHGVQAAAPWVAGRAAYAFASAGREADFERAVDLVRSGTDLSPSMRHGFAFTWAARGCLALGRFEQAAELGLRALRNPTPDPERGVHAWAHWVLGEAARNTSPADLNAAGRAYEAALDLACELDMRALEAHCRSGKARIAAARGDHEAADAHARRAREIAGNIGLAPGADASWPPPTA